MSELAKAAVQTSARVPSNSAERRWWPEEGAGTGPQVRGGPSQ